MEKKVLFVVPDGVGVKNYLLSDFISLLLKNGFEVVLLHNLSSDAICEIEKYHHTTFEQISLLSYNEKPLLKFIREGIALARLKNNARIIGNSTILSNWNPSKKGIKKLFYGLIKPLAHYTSQKYHRILKLEKLYDSLLGSLENPYEAILQQIKPNVVFNTHQRSLLSLLPLRAAKKLKINTIGTIFSWDNLPKARLTAPSDKYVVWSSYMKEELQFYYPEISEDRIYITGTPQFEHYYNPKWVISREEFCISTGLDVHKKIIVYSGGDLKTSPYDQLYVEALADELQKAGLHHQYQILIRPAPVDFTNRYDAVIEAYKDFVKLSRPKWIQNQDWAKTFPTFEDVILQVNTVYHSETVINVGSSMAFDYATMQKPAIYINFNVKNKSKNWDINTINNFQHFKSMETLHPVFWWNEKPEILSILDKIQHGEYSLDADKWFQKINNYPEKASSQLFKLLDKVCI